MRNVSIIVLVLVLLAGVAFYVYSAQEQTDTSLQTTSDLTASKDHSRLWPKALAPDSNKKIPASANTIKTVLPYLPTPEVNGNVYTYVDTLLDQDGFSKIRRLDIVQDKKGIQAITIDGLQLTGEIDDTGEFQIIGFENKHSVIAALLSGVPKITIQNSTLSVLTKHIGGLSFDYDLIGQHTADGGLNLQGTVESKQKNLKFVSAVDGLITPSGTWKVNAALEQFSLDLKTVRVARGNGQFSFEGDDVKNSAITLAGSYGLGGLSFYKFPWQNAKGTLRGTADTPIFDLFATALGQDDIQMDMTIDTTGNDLTIGGDVRTARMANLLTYIERHNGLSTDRTGTLQGLENTANISIDFGIEGIQSALRDRVVYRVNKPFEGKGAFLLSKPD